MDWILEEPFKTIFAALIGALIGGGAIWGVMRATRRRIHRRDMTAAETDRFNILVADLLHDDDGSERKHIIHALEHYPGLRTLEIGGIHAVIDLGDHAAQVEAAETKGRKILEEKNGDILLWGEVAKHGDGRVLRLRFLSRGGEGGGPANPYALDKSFKMPAQFNTDLASLIAAQAFAAVDPKSEQQEIYAVHRLRGVIDRVGHLVSHDLPGFAPETMAELRLSAANAAITLGDQAGERDALENAVAWCRRVEDTERVNDRELEARAAGTRGIALQTLGEREEGTARLEEAVGAYRSALEVRTRTDLPLDWATTQNNLGTALKTLGEREEGSARLEEAVTAYGHALEVYTRTDLPLQWATTQNNLGVVLRTLGEREEGTARLEEAVTAYRSALEVRTRTDLPLQWAMTQNNLGTVLRLLANARRARPGSRRRSRPTAARWRSSRVRRSTMRALHVEILNRC